MVGAASNMKLHSRYLNPFQPFPERELEGDGLRPAIEDNMSRAVFCALANGDRPLALAVFLRELARCAEPGGLQDRIERFAATLENTDPATVEFDLQSWPRESALDEPQERKILIGISSSHITTWSHNTRRAPDEPRADGWIYVPGQMLLVFECKNDSHPLDATQVSAYVWGLRLPRGEDCVPCPDSGLCLDAGEAGEFQAKCKEWVLDVPWSAVINALTSIQTDVQCGPVERWLSGQAAAYIALHARPPYLGVGTILDWLKGPDTPERREHLRTLIRKMGDAIAEADAGPQAITFTKDAASGGWEVFPGVSAAFYVRLCRGGQPVQFRWLRKDARLNLWASFSEDLEKRIGLDYWVEASGVQLNQCAQDSEKAWNDASSRLCEAARAFEADVDAWVRTAPAGTLVEVNPVRFKGKRKAWQGGGELARDGLYLPPARPEQALAFLKTYRSALWRFPTVGPGGEFPTINAAQPWVRKPALAIRPPLEVSALRECGNDPHELQRFLGKAVTGALDQGLVAQRETTRE